MKIYLGADHAGFNLKEKIKAYLLKKGYQVEDMGNTALEPGDDYPDYAYPVAKLVAASDGQDRGILFCGSGIGVNIVVNKVRGIRSMNALNQIVAKRAREHEDINVLSLGGIYVNEDQAKRIVDLFLTTPKSRATRHARSIEKIIQLERNR